MHIANLHGANKARIPCSFEGCDKSYTAKVIIVSDSFILKSLSLRSERLLIKAYKKTLRYHNKNRLQVVDKTFIVITLMLRFCIYVYYIYIPYVNLKTIWSVFELKRNSFL